MPTKNIIVLLLLCFAIAFYPCKTRSVELQIEETKPLEVIVINKTYIDEKVNQFSDMYGIDSKLVSKVIECESKYDHTNLGDGGRAFGVMQYHKASFLRHAKLMGEPNLDYYSTYDQIKVGTWALANGHAREWTSYRAIMNGGTYAFYSKLLKNDYVIKCKL